MHSTLNQRPDLYLDELRQDLLDTCGVSVSIPTIWRTLVKGGYSMKKVLLLPDHWSHQMLMNFLLLTAYSCCTWAKCGDAKWLCSSHRHLWAFPAHLYWWKCCWSSLHIPWESMGHLREKGMSKSIFLSGAKVSIVKNWSPFSLIQFA